MSSIRPKYRVDNLEVPGHGLKIGCLQLKSWLVTTCILAQNLQVVQVHLDRISNTVQVEDWHSWSRPITARNLALYGPKVCLIRHKSWLGTAGMSVLYDHKVDSVWLERQLDTVQVADRHSWIRQFLAHKFLTRP